MTNPTDHEFNAVLARVMNRIKVNEAGCWLWLGACRHGGYGAIGIKNKLEVVHRVMYEIVRGPIPCGLVIDHLCRSRNYVNPDHLEAVTVKENLARGFTATKNVRCPNGHLYSKGNTMLTPHRRCRICWNEWVRKYESRPENKAKKSERYYANREKRLAQMRAYDKKEKKGNSRCTQWNNHRKERPK